MVYGKLGNDGITVLNGGKVAISYENLEVDKCGTKERLPELISRY